MGLGCISVTNRRVNQAVFERWSGFTLVSLPFSLSPFTTYLHLMLLNVFFTLISSYFNVFLWFYFMLVQLGVLDYLT